MATRNNRRGAVKPRPGVKPRPATATPVEPEGPLTDIDGQVDPVEPETEAVVDPDTGEVVDEETVIDPEDVGEPVIGEEVVADVVTADEVNNTDVLDPEVTNDPRTTDSDGDGIADEFDLDETEYRKYWTKYLAESGVSAPKGRILYPGEPLTFQGNVLQGDNVLLSEDVYRMVVPFRSRRPTFVLEARKGTIVPRVKVVTKTQYRKAVGGLFDAVLVD